MKIALLVLGVLNVACMVVNIFTSEWWLAAFNFSTACYIAFTYGSVRRGN